MDTSRCGWPVSCCERSYHYASSITSSIGRSRRSSLLVLEQQNAPSWALLPARASSFKLRRSAPRPVCSQSYVALNVRSDSSDCTLIDMYLRNFSTGFPSFHSAALRRGRVQPRGANPPGANKLEVVPSRKGTRRFPAYMEGVDQGTRLCSQTPPRTSLLSDSP